MMSRSKPSRKLSATELPDVLALLSGLHGRGRYIARSDVAAPVITIRGPGSAPIATVGAKGLADALRCGWVAPVADDDGAIRLTAAGREALRRARVRLAAERVRSTVVPPSAPGAHATTKEQSAGAAVRTSSPGWNPAESPLSWLAGRRDPSGRPMLSPTEIQAGERLQADISFAQLTPRVTMGWSGIPITGDRRSAAAGHGRDLADNVIAARARVTAALEAVGPEHADILIDVCGHLRGLEEIARAENWPRRAARLLLQRGLSALARHYGLEPHVQIEETIARRLRHWGTDDYRPTLARWTGAKPQAD